jgi:hypothetical protein
MDHNNIKFGGGIRMSERESERDGYRE